MLPPWGGILLKAFTASGLIHLTIRILFNQESDAFRSAIRDFILLLQALKNVFVAFE